MTTWQVPRDENWKVAKLLLEQFVPPARTQDPGGGLAVCSLPDSLQVLHSSYISPIARL